MEATATPAEMDSDIETTGAEEALSSERQRENVESSAP
jgi:hypothetical protein